MLMITPDTPDAEDRAKNLIRQIEAHLGHRLLCIYQNQALDELIDEDTLYLTKLALTAMGKQEKLSVLIDSPGGDIDSAYRMVRVLRRYADDVDVIVAKWAKSAATFFCLGADRILMAPDAELGPLDSQLLDPRGSRSRKSALNAFKSLEYLRQYAIETFDQLVVQLMVNGGLDIPYAMEAARPLVSDIVGPLYSQVDPRELGESNRYLGVAEEYGIRVMQRYGYSDMSASDVSGIVKKLVWNYPSHGFVIDIVEAQELGLNAEPLDEEVSTLCECLLSTVQGCFGFLPPEEHGPTAMVEMSPLVPLESTPGEDVGDE